MFEKFTKNARTAVVEAQQVARELRSPRIDTRHLLVALLEADGAPGEALRTLGSDPDDVARRSRASLAADDALDAQALASLGVDLDAVRASTDRVFGKGALDGATRRRPAPAGHVPFTADAKKALELGLREAIRLKERSIDPRHLVLGILRADCPGGRLLADAAAEAGSDVPALRHAVEKSRDAA